jgi:hypothetical protein
MLLRRRWWPHLGAVLGMVRTVCLTRSSSDALMHAGRRSRPHVGKVKDIVAGAAMRRRPFVRPSVPRPGLCPRQESPAAGTTSQASGDLRGTRSDPEPPWGRAAQRQGRAAILVSEAAETRPKVRRTGLRRRLADVGDRREVRDHGVGSVRSHVGLRSVQQSVVDDDRVAGPHLERDLPEMICHGRVPRGELAGLPVAFE